MTATTPAEERAAGVDRRNASLRDRARHDDGVEQSLKTVIAGVDGRAAHFCGTFNPISRRADERLTHAAAAIRARAPTFAARA